MPCFTRERSLPHPHAPPRRPRGNGRDLMAPKPVRPIAMRYHGLFGMSIVAQHLIVDDKWTPDSLSEQFTDYIHLLKRRVIFNRHETRFNRKHLSEASAKLKTMCTDGRIKLQKISTGNNAHKIRNLLSNHRDLQRLYQRMPIHLIVDNINQRTFVMRKERDRLFNRLEQRKDEYRTLLIRRAQLENLIRYENEFSVQEESASRVIRKKIENSNVRVKAIVTINNAYKKLTQLLLYDELFYEPILRSLEGDMEDQANFIKHIIYLGKPALGKFKVLSKEYQNLQKKARDNLQAKIKMIASTRKPPTVFVPPTDAGHRQTIAEKVEHYVRQTKSMTELKYQLNEIEKTIKDLKIVTFCSQAKEIYPRVHQQIENNRKLTYTIQSNQQLYKSLKDKKNYCSLLQEVLENNLSEEEVNRHERIRELQQYLKADKEFEEECHELINSRSYMYVLFRLFLWNLIDILKYVDRQPYVRRTNYPNSYLKLPLLRFEMLHMYATAPELYEEDLDKIMDLLKRKLYKLMEAYNNLNIDKEKIAIGKEKYHQEFLQTIIVPEVSEDQGTAAQDDDYQKAMMSIPNSKQLKIQSARLVEQCLKREE